MISRLAAAPDGKTLISASYDHTIRYWDVPAKLPEPMETVPLNQTTIDNLKRANITAADYRGALHILTPRSEHWHPPVETYSALTGDGIAKLWQKILDHRTAMKASGEFAARRFKPAVERFVGL